MRRSSLDLLCCPRCAGPLRIEGEQQQLSFGPVECSLCGEVFPLSDGLLDLVGGPTSSSFAQRVLESPAVARSYERGVRSALRDVGMRTRLDEATERLAVRALAAPPASEPVLDLSCGTGLHARSLAEGPGVGPVLGVDRSLAMLDEALHHQREARVPVDLVRAEASALPLRAGRFAVVVNVGAFHLYEDAGKVLAEIARVLRPGGRFVCGTLLPDVLGVVRRAERRAGVFRRSEDELRALCEKAGFSAFERLLLPPAILFRVEKPAVSGV